MNLKQCILALEADGKKLSPAKKKEAVSYLKRAAGLLTAEGNGPDLDPMLLSAKVRELIEMDTQAQIKSQILNTKIGLQNQNFVKANYIDEPGKGLFALIGDIALDRPGARAGLYQWINAKKAKYQQGLTSDLANDGVLELAMNGSLDNEVASAMYELNKSLNSKGNYKANLGGVSEDAVKIAKHFVDYQRMVRSEANSAGANIGLDANYLFSRNHDQHKIGSAGGNKFGSKEAKAAWIEDLEKMGIDYQKMFPELDTIDQYRDAMGNIYQSLSNGYHLVFGGGGDPRASGIGSVAKKVSHERVIQFKDAAADLAYMNKYGAGGNLLSNILSDFSYTARDVAIMEKLGPSGLENLRGAVDKLKEDFHNSAQPQKVVEIDKQFREIENVVWPELSGKNSIPANTVAAKAMGGIRSLLSWSMLGGSVLSSITDAASSASAVRYFTGRDAKSFNNALKELLEAEFSEIKNIPNALKGKPLPDSVRQKMDALGIFIDNVQPGFIKETDLDGRMQFFNDLYYKINGLSQWTRGVKSASVAVTNNFYANHIDKSFVDLPDGMKAAFRQFDISENEWGIISKAKLFEDEHGRKFIDVNAITDVESKFFNDHKLVLEAKDKIEFQRKEILESKTLSNQDKDDRIVKLEKKADKLISAAKDDAGKELQDKWRGMMNEIASIAATEPGTIERAYMFHGTQRGTVPGEIMRSLMQFKSFTFRFMRAHLYRELRGYDPVTKSIPQMMKDLFFKWDNAPVGSKAGPASLISTGVLLGIVANYLKDATKGQYKPIESPMDVAKVLSAGLSRSGGLGFYGDFIFGDYFTNEYGRSGLEGALGPTWSFASDTAQLIGVGKDSVADMENKYKMAQFIRYGKSYIPGVSTLNNHFLTSYISNKLIFHNLMEWSNPGYLRKYEKNVRQKGGKEFFDSARPTNRWEF